MVDFHRNYIEIVAKDHYDLGVQLGIRFKSQTLAVLNDLKMEKHWNRFSSLARSYYQLCQEYFPDISEEMRGYSHGVGISEIEMFQLIVEDEFSEKRVGRCTTIVTNGGDLVAHNEDWDQWSKDAICLLKKTVNGKSIFEVFYYSTLGGNSISINNFGVLQAINSLDHNDSQRGVAKNIISRWLSGSCDIESDLEKLQFIPRSSGYHHLLLQNKQGYSVECSALKMNIRTVEYPFVHTNHYLSSLKEVERDKIDFSQERFDYATKYLQEYMSERDLMKLMRSQELGSKKSLFNERTIAQVIVDRKHKVAKVWMAQESEKGWISYPLEVNDD